MTHNHKTQVRALSLLLAAVMLFSALGMTASAATRDNVQHYDTYMCIGDSIAAGFYVDGDSEVGRKLEIMPHAYHSIVAEATDAELLQFGWSAFRAVELRYMLEGVRHDLDNTWQDLFGFLISDEQLEPHRSAYLDAIKKADLITVNLGSNDVFSYSMKKTLNLLSSSSDSELAAEVKDIMSKCGDFGTAFVKVLGYAEKAGKLPIVMASLNPTLMKAVSAFKENFTACMRGIYKLNPNATVVVVGLYNPLANVSLVENGNLKLAALVQPTVDLMNQFLKYGCLYSDRYRFAPVPNVTTWKMSLIGGDFASEVITKVHPTAAGHSYMADQILSVLPEAQQPAADPDAGRFPFIDVAAQSWYYDHVKFVWEHGVMQGTGPKTFDPDSNTTRAQFATVLYRMAGSPAVSAADKANCPFTDLKADWYQDAVAWAYKSSVVKGTSATTFTPDQIITREQMVTMLWRSDGQKQAGSALSAFTDRGAISDYARPAVAWAVENGIVGGMPDGSFQPKGTATRAQLATILHRYMAQ